MKRTSATAPNRISTALRTLPTTCSMSGTTLMVNEGSRCFSCRRRAAMMAMSDCAVSMLTPGFSRARML
jgi:hypothetical protein